MSALANTWSLYSVHVIRCVLAYDTLKISTE